MNIEDLKNTQQKCIEHKKKLATEIQSRQKWINYFNEKKQKAEKNCKSFLLNALGYLIVSLCSILLSGLPFIGSAFLGLSIGCFIVSGYQKYVVCRKFNKVLKATQKNLDICIKNTSKLTELENEITKQLETLNSISKQVELGEESLKVSLLQRKNNSIGNSTTNDFDI